MVYLISKRYSDQIIPQRMPERTQFWSSINLQCTEQCVNITSLLMGLSSLWATNYPIGIMVLWLHIFYQQGEFIADAWTEKYIQIKNGMPNWKKYTWSNRPFLLLDLQWFFYYFYLTWVVNFVFLFIALKIYNLSLLIYVKQCILHYIYHQEP